MWEVNELYRELELFTYLYVCLRGFPPLTNYRMPVPGDYKLISLCLTGIYKRQ